MKSTDLEGVTDIGPDLELDKNFGYFSFVWGNGEATCGNLHMFSSFIFESFPYVSSK